MTQVNLPDFDDMTMMISNIGDLSMKIELLKLEIGIEEAKIVTTCTSDTKYFIGEKPPSMSHLGATVMRTGLNGELIEKRQQLARLEASQEVLKKTFELMKTKIDVWRSQQANERMSVS